MTWVMELSPPPPSKRSGPLYRCFGVFYSLFMKLSFSLSFMELHTGQTRPNFASEESYPTLISFTENHVKTLHIMGTTSSDVHHFQKCIL